MAYLIHSCIVCQEPREDFWKQQDCGLKWVWTQGWLYKDASGMGSVLYKLFKSSQLNPEIFNTLVQLLGYLRSGLIYSLSLRVVCPV